MNDEELIAWGTECAPLYYCLDCDRGFTSLHAYNSELHLPCPGRRRNA